MKKVLLFLITLIVFFIGYFFLSAYYGKPETLEEYPPCLNNGKKWTIGYMQGGSLTKYDISFKNFIDQLAAKGWLKPVDWTRLPSNPSVKEMWRYLARNINSKYLRIDMRYFWDSEWDSNKRQYERKKVLNILKSDNVDFMIAMGMWAGQDIMNDTHSVPVIYMGSSFPIQRYFERDKSDKGIPDHVYFPKDPDFLLRQVLMFKKITKFKKLGVVYEASSEGRFLACLEILKSQAKRNGFELVAIRILPYKKMDSKEKLKEEIDAYKKLASQIDAAWLTSFFINDPAAAEKILKPLFKHRIPTWYPHGRTGITNGAVFGLIHNPQNRARHYASITSKILNGIKPSSLIKKLPIDTQLVINYAAADKIGLQMPRVLLAAAKKSYLNINSGKK
jgi:ABC-type uncharacterized transport system substrate-binding protein